MPQVKRQKTLPRGTDEAASEGGKADFRRVFGMGRFGFRRTQVRPGQGFALSQRAMALSPAISGGRTAGTEQ